MNFSPQQYEELDKIISSRIIEVESKLIKKIQNQKADLDTLASIIDDTYKKAQEIILHFESESEKSQKFK